MEIEKNKNVSISVEQLIPEYARSKNGVEVYLGRRIWEYYDGSSFVYINFDKIKNCSLEFKDCFKYVLLWYLENRSGKHLNNIFTMFVRFVDKIFSKEHVAEEINDFDVLNYYAMLDNDKKYYLGVLSGFFKRWHGLGIPGVSNNVISIFNKIKIKGNRKGHDVLTLDPEKGPFTDNELTAIQVKLNNCFAEGEVELQDYLFCWIFILFGIRSSQLCLMKICDFRFELDSEEKKIYYLNVPRVKQRNIKLRTEFKERIISPDIGDLILEHVRYVKNIYNNYGIELDQLPIFPEEANRDNKFHMTTNNAYYRLKKIFDSMNVISERTGEQIKIKPSRFRYTLGTRAAQEGHGELIIAELLDHSDTQNVGVYVKNTPEIIKRIDKALAYQIAPLAQAFAGVIIEDESKAKRGDDPSSRIVDPKIDPSFKPMGSCGKFGFCGFMAPIACYTCKNFEPWLDGPHEKVLDHLLKEKERLLSVADERIASTHDRAIYAVAEVVRRCKEIKGAING